MSLNELSVPPAVLEDEQAFEILRLWAALGEQHVTIRPDLSGDAYQFGYLIAQLAEHGARLYAQRSNQSVEECRSQILHGFNAEIADPTGDGSGSIPTDH